MAEPGLKCRPPDFCPGLSIMSFCLCRDEHVLHLPYNHLVNFNDCLNNTTKRERRAYFYMSYTGYNTFQPCAIQQVLPEALINVRHFSRNCGKYSGKI